MKRFGLLVLSALLCLTVFAGCNNAQNTGGNGEGDNSPQGGDAVNNFGFANVLDYGATAGDTSDDFAAFAKAALTGKTLYVPAGTYYLSKPLQLRNQNLKGDGMFQSKILSSSASSEDAVLCLGRTCSVEDLTVGFMPTRIKGNETVGQRVGIYTGDDMEPSWPLQRGSQINRVRIENTGTAIYSPNKDGAESFSVAYENLEIADFSFRGIDFRSKIRTGNFFSNIYMFSKYEVDSIFNMTGEESETTIIQLNLEHTKVKRAVLSLNGCRALDISSVHIEGVLLTKDDADFVYLKNSSGRIGALSVYYSGFDRTVDNVKNNSLFEIGDAVYDINESWQVDKPDTLGNFTVNTLHVKGLNDTNVPLHGARGGLKATEGFAFFKRTDGALGKAKVRLDNYVYFTFKNAAEADADEYAALNTEGNLDLVKTYL